jgi:cell wall-associated NlpC family hydrolase
MNPKAQAVADAAVSLLAYNPPIPYKLGGQTTSAMDCEGLVQWCVRKAGGASKYAGSNDMWRHDVQWSGTLAQAQAQGRLIPGAAVFVVKKNGQEPAKYQGDGYGNAQHIGMYCGEPNAECVSASTVTCHVGTTVLSQGWTHVAWLKNVDYSSDAEAAEPEQPTIDYAKAVEAAKAFIEAVGGLGNG